MRSKYEALVGAGVRDIIGVDNRNEVKINEKLSV